MTRKNKVLYQELYFKKNCIRPREVDVPELRTDTETETMLLLHKMLNLMSRDHFAIIVNNNYFDNNKRLKNANKIEK